MAAVFKAVADTAFMFVSATVAATASFRVPIRTGGAPGAHTTRDVCAPGWPGNGGGGVIFHSLMRRLDAGGQERAALPQVMREWIFLTWLGN